MMIYEDQDFGMSSNETDNKLGNINDENFFSIKLNEVSFGFSEKRLIFHLKGREIKK